MYPLWDRPYTTKEFSLSHPHSCTCTHRRAWAPSAIDWAFLRHTVCYEMGKIPHKTGCADKKRSEKKAATKKHKSFPLPLVMKNFCTASGKQGSSFSILGNTAAYVLNQSHIMVSNARATKSQCRKKGLLRKHVQLHLLNSELALHLGTGNSQKTV